ncbi:MAG: mannose-1-phosphate guanylyltransferase [Rhizobiales bacterium]|nr:mannose-1-phosphate guanylyltransferase [Hyphomicrobiales bacterium]
MTHKAKIRPVVLCGGSGTRLWPLSRPDFPKQFLALKGNASLLEQTLLRAAAAGGGEPPILIAAAQHRELVVDSLDRAGADAALILEPSGRNTAPAVAAAALVAAGRHPDDVLVVMPSDHVVDGIEGFVASVEAASRLARAGWITVLGVVPNEASSAFGYIVPGESLGEDGSRVARFVEKPPREAAEELRRAGAFWNAGMVVAKASVLIEALREHEPAVLAGVEDTLRLGALEPECRLDAEAFARVPKMSFDHAVLERHARVAVTPLLASWRDVGTWGEVAALYQADPDGNRVVGDACVIQSKNSFIRSSERQVVALGVENLFVVDTPDGLLVAHGGCLPLLGKAVESLRNNAPRSLDTARPDWGGVQLILQNAASRVSRFAVQAGQATPPDAHGELPGHWICVAGGGVATIGARICGVNSGETLALPGGEERWIANTGQHTLEVIEVLLQVPMEKDAELRRAV